MEEESGDKKTMHLMDVHFFNLPSQGNVYSNTSLTDAKGNSRLLVASLQRKVYCLEYSRGRPCMKEVPFTYIPAGAEIISIDAINRSVIQEDFIIGITIIKKDENNGVPSQFFNIYSDWDLNSDSALDVVSQNCFPLSLSFVPYHLYHADARGKNGWETVWLLSGSDCNIHLYLSNDDSYEEGNTVEYFPEFSSLEDTILLMNVSYSSDKTMRMTAVCGEGGSVHVFRVSTAAEPRVTASRSVTWDYPVAAVAIFPLTPAVHMPKFLQELNITEKARLPPHDDPGHLVVATTLESCFTYRDFLGQSGGFHLPDSDGNDVVTCCIVCDIDHDGRNEVLIGTYGQVVIAYKQCEAQPGTWRILHKIKVACPVLSLLYCDVIGDGSSQLIVMTTTGIHIFQHNPWKMVPEMLKRLELLVSSISAPKSTSKLGTKHKSLQRDP